MNNQNFIVREDGTRVAMRYQGKKPSFIKAVAINAGTVIALLVMLAVLFNLPVVQAMLAWVK